MSDETVQTGTISTEAPAEVLEQAAESLEAAAPEPKPEEKVVEVEKAAEEDKRFAAKFAALTRREKEIRQREKAVEQRLRQIEAQMKQEPAKVEPVVEPLERRIRKDPFNTLKELGVDYSTLTQIALNDGKLTPDLQMQLMREEIENGYKSEISEIKKAMAERVESEKKAKEQAAIDSFKAGIANSIVGNAEQYELLAAEGEYGVDLVYDVIDRHYQETEDVMDVQEAANLVEEHLLEEAKKRIELKKIKKLLEPSQAKVPTEPSKVPKKTSATLSNEASQVQPNTGRFLSDEESKREAAKLIKFNS